MVHEDRPITGAGKDIFTDNKVKPCRNGKERT